MAITTTEKKIQDIKCVIWDLDNTLWDGVLAENDEVTLKPGIVDIIKILDSRGILHSIASKNNFDDAIKKLEEFGIKDYFLFPEIHWEPKSSSISRIQKNFNIGLDTLLFIDDQQFERDEVNFVYKEIECIAAESYNKLPDMPRLNPKFITEDSARRRLMYLEDMYRKTEEQSFQGTPEKFLATLNLDFQIAPATIDDLKRAEELTVRTHQLNSTGLTFSYDELKSFCHSQDHLLLICELKDKYGSYGKIGLALLEIQQEHLYLKLLLMSCRVISRGVGTVFMSYIMELAKKRGKKLLADFLKTDKNRQMYVAYKFANFNEIKVSGDYVLFENDLSYIQPVPSYIKLTICK